MATSIVIVGGGFGGLSCARKLARVPDTKVTLVDRRNHHLFQPLLYQVATAALSPADIAVPIRSIFTNDPNIECLMEDVVSVDRERRVLVTTTGELSFDYLILATGSRDSYFGHQDWEPYAPGLKSLEQATEIRRRILLAYEEAEKCKNPDEQKALMTFVVVGGGATGVELAGAISEISRTTLEKDFRHIDPSSARVLLIEAGPRILAAFDESLSRKAKSDLEKMGVQIWTSTRVTNVTADGVVLANESVSAKTVIWAAGVAASPLGASLKVPLDRGGRVVVGNDLTIPGDSKIFIIGDLAAVTGEGGRTLPGLAPVAMQEGRYVARTILNEMRGYPRKPFTYLDKGSLATIGRRKAVLQFKSIKMSGFLAWYVWLFIHIFYIVNFHNRVLIFIQWAWSYLTFKRGARLIVDKDWQRKTI